MPKAEYTYTLRAFSSAILQQIDVEFEYTIERDPGCAPRIDVDAVFMEGNTNLMQEPQSWLRGLGFDIADQIQSDEAFCSQLIEGTEEDFTAYQSHQRDLDGLRTYGRL